MSNEFIKNFIDIRDNKERQDNFVSNAINKDKRLFKILNANIKTYNTYYKYLYEVINKPDVDNHQKYKILRDLGLYYSDEEDELIKNRISIALKIYDNFEENSFIRNFMIFLFSLKSKLEIDKSAAFLSDVLPEEILSHYNDFLKEAYIDASIINPVYAFYVFYSDRDFLYSYIDYYMNMQPNDKLRLIALNDDKNNFINSRRIHDLQKGSLLNEALIGGLYLKLCEIDLSEIEGYDNIIHKIISEYHGLIDFLNLDNKPTQEEWDKLEKILNELKPSEKEEILRSLGNVSENIENYEPDDTKKSIKMVMKVKGFDVERTVHQRVGQSVFRKNLIEQFEGCKCRVKDCKINKVEYLIASHILEWTLSDETQKTDPNNGFLLCPMHDFLFDGHLISFDDNGEIMISENIPEEFYDEFNISKESCVDILEENKIYLELHRRAFNGENIKEFLEEHREEYFQDNVVMEE